MYARPFHPDLPLMAMRVSSFSRAKDELKMHRWECMVLLLDQICGMPALRARILPARVRGARAWRTATAGCAQLPLFTIASSLGSDEHSPCQQEQDRGKDNLAA